MDLRSRKYVLTYFTDLEDVSSLFLTLPYDVVIISPLHTIPSKHYHLIVQHKNPIKFNTLKNILPTAHIEKQFGSNLQAYNYLFHKGEETKEQLKEEDIKSNIDLKSWLNGVENEKDQIGLEVLEVIETSSTLWEVVKRFPSYWRDISRFKDLWHVYRIHKYQTKGFSDYASEELVKEEDIQIDNDLKYLNDVLFNKTQQ